jgi:site-specific DNA-methyltransferase (adenine-specific)
MRIFRGDNLEHLQFEESNSIDAVVTDPPYGLSFMGKKWDYDVPSVELWREVFRVLKPGGHLLSFGGTRTYHRMVVNIEDAGFEIRDQVQWIYGSGFPKSMNVGKQNPEWFGWGTALKPANEPIVLARKPLEKGLTVAENVLKWGTGAINIDGARIEAADQSILDAAVKRMTGNAAVGWKNTSSDGIKPNSAHGRWPANVLFDESAAEMLDAQSGDRVAGNFPKVQNTKSWKMSSQGKGLSEPRKTDSGGASRFFYVAKTSKRERNAGIQSNVGNGKPGETSSEDRRAQNFHPTVKPIKLMEYLITLITPPNGTVLDPFMGSGSTGCAAKKLKRKFVGIELDEEYFKIASQRIRSL